LFPFSGLAETVKEVFTLGKIVLDDRRATTDVA